MYIKIYIYICICAYLYIYIYINICLASIWQLPTSRFLPPTFRGAASVTVAAFLGSGQLPPVSIRFHRHGVSPPRLGLPPSRLPPATSRTTSIERLAPSSFPPASFSGSFKPCFSTALTIVVHVFALQKNVFHDLT